MRRTHLFFWPALALLLTSFAIAQDEPVLPSTIPASPAKAEIDVAEPVGDAETEVEEIGEETNKAVNETAQQVEKTVDSVSNQIDASPQAQEISAGILQPIYLVAEWLAFPMFHWVAFTLMAAGVVSFAFQLVLGKLIVLANRGFSMKEIISDAVGLMISLVGLVLTTQAAAENSTFTDSAAAVLSATAIGAILGLVLYSWGQRQEIQAAHGRTAEVKNVKAKQK